MLMPTEETDAIRHEWLRLTGGKVQPPGHPDFYVPDAYFTSFPQRLLQRLKEEPSSDILSRDETVLTEIELPRHVPFAVPEQYFENFPQQLMRRLQTDAVVRSKRKRLTRLVSYALAACLVGFGIMGWWMHQRRQSLQARLEHIPTEAIAQYLEQHTDLFNSDWIVRQLGSEAISLSLPENNSITADDIREYLDLDSVPDASFMQ